MPDEPEVFIQRTFMTSLYVTLAFVIILFLFLGKSDVSPVFILIGAPIVFIVLFNYLMRIPDLKAIRVDKEIRKEIVFAGRFLIIELESGVPLYNALVNASRHYKAIGQSFKRIVDKVDLGTSLDDAINEETEITPSANLRKILWQILNSLKTGSDISKSLNSVIDQVVQEQRIEVSAYGRKLNPLAMFYLMFAIIMPSLGATIFLILSTFIGLQISLPFFLMFAGFVGFVQFIFVSVVKAQRPAVQF